MSGLMVSKLIMGIIYTTRRNYLLIITLKLLAVSYNEIKYTKIIILPALKLFEFWDAEFFSIKNEGIELPSMAE